MKKYVILIICLAITEITTTFVFYKFNKSSIFYYKGRRLFEARLHQESIPYFERSLELKKDFIPALRDLGIASLSVGKYQRAKECFQALLKLDPKNRLAHRGYADVLSREGKFKEAIPMYKKMLSETPTDVLTMRSLADAFYWDKNCNEAIPYYKTFLITDPTQQEALVNLADCFMQTGQEDHAAQIINTLELTFSTSTQALKAVARFYFINKEVNKAKTYYEKALKISPDDLDALVQLAYIYNGEGNSAKAISIISTAADEHPTDQMLQIKRANFLLWNKRYDEAETKFLDINKRWPDDPLVQEGLAHVYFWQGKAKLALPYLEKLINKNENDMTSAQELAQAYAASGNLEDAANVYNNIILTKQDIAVNVMLDAAYINYNLKKYQTTKEIVWKILKKDPENIKAMNLLKKLKKLKQR